MRESSNEQGRPACHYVPLPTQTPLCPHICFSLSPAPLAYLLTGKRANKGSSRVDFAYVGGGYQAPLCHHLLPYLEIPRRTELSLHQGSRKKNKNQIKPSLIIVLQYKYHLVNTQKNPTEDNSAARKIQNGYI